MKAASGSTTSRSFVAFVRAEYPFFIGLATAVTFLALGNQILEDVAHPLLVSAIFVVLLAAVLWSAVSVVRHADCLAVKCGEPYGTIIITLSAISIDVVIVSAAMLHGTNTPSHARYNI